MKNLLNACTSIVAGLLFVIVIQNLLHFSINEVSLTIAAVVVGTGTFALLNRHPADPMLKELYKDR